MISTNPWYPTSDLRVPGPKAWHPSDLSIRAEVPDAAFFEAERPEK